MASAIDTILFASNYPLFVSFLVRIRSLLVHKNNFSRSGVIYKAKINLDRMDTKVKFVNFSNEYNFNSFFFSFFDRRSEEVECFSPRFENNLKTLTVYKTGYSARSERLGYSRGRSLYSYENQALN